MKLNDIIDDHFFNDKESVCTGLIHPHGKSLESDFFMHLDTAKNHPEFLTKDLSIKVKEYGEKINEVYLECGERAKETQHGEWHLFEMIESDLNTKFLNDLYDAGYLRYYIEFKRRVGQTFGILQIYCNVTLEGKRFEDHYDLIIYLQNKYRVTLTLDKKYTTK